MPLSPARLLAFATRLPVLIAAGLYALWVAFGFLAVDPLAQKLLPWLGREKLASELSASKVEFNPLTLEATVTGLKLAEPGGAPLASAERVYANLDIAGLFRFAWRIRDLGLDAPRASFDIRADGTHNWRKLFDKLAEDKEPPSDTLPRVLIDRIRIARGDLRFSDARRAGEPFRAAATPLDFSLDGLSTLPEDRGDYTLAAKLPEQGGTLKWRGEIGLNPVASNGRVALEGVKLANLTRLVKSERRFDVASGALAAALDYRFALLHTRQGEDVPSLRIDHGTLAIADLALAPRGGAPLARLASLRVDGAQFDLLRREARLAGVRLNGLDVAATRRADGAFDWLELLPPPAAAPAPAGAKGDKSQAGAPWKLAVGAIALADGALRYTDQSFAAPLALAADGLGFNATLDAAFGDTTRLTLGGLHVALGTTTLHSGKTELARLQGAALADGAYTLADSSLSVGALEFSGLAGAVVLDAQKRLNWAEALKPARGARQPAAREATPGAPPLRLALAKLALADFAVRVEDRSAKTPVRLDLVNGYVRLAGLSHDPARAIPVEAGFSVRQGGRFSARGEFVPGKPAGKFALELAGLSLKPFAPYVNQAARLKLQSGAAGWPSRPASAASGSTTPAVSRSTTWRSPRRTPTRPFSAGSRCARTASKSRSIPTAWRWPSWWRPRPSANSSFSRTRAST